MSNISEIRFHVRSVKQTRQITNAMYLVSASRIRKAMHALEQNKAHFMHALTTMRDIRAGTPLHHPYLVRRAATGKTAYIVIAGEKGLSGSYNHDVLLLAQKSVEAREVSRIFTVGDVATSFFAKQGYTVNANFSNIAKDPTINTARRIVSIVMNLYDTGEIDEMRLVYTRFLSSSVHEPTDIALLPLELDAFGLAQDTRIRDGQFLYEPSPEAVFDALIPQYIIGYLYGALVQSYASENTARMAAMQNATKSADEMLERLTQQYHSLRQLAITNELSEIISAAESTQP